MKKYLRFISLLILTLFITSCDSDSPTGSEDNANSLVGVWNWTMTTVTDGTDTVSSTPSTTASSETIILNEDGTASMQNTSSDGTITGSGTWSVNGTMITIIINLSGESAPYTLILDYTISGNTFIGTRQDYTYGYLLLVTYYYTRT